MNLLKKDTSRINFYLKLLFLQEKKIKKKLIQNFSLNQIFCFLQTQKK
jgi:hypothetical protein